MLKLLIYFIVIELLEQSNSVMSAIRSTGECKIYSYKPFNVRNNIFSNISNETLISNLSIVGTHESVSYQTPELKIQTQELSVAEQLQYGVRLLDLTVRYSNSQILQIYSRSVNLKYTLEEVFDTVDEFLRDNEQEFVFINLKYDGPVNHDDEDKTLYNYLSDDFLKPCKLFKSLNPRVTRNWNLRNTVKSVRGKILLSTTDSVFENCMFKMNEECLVSNNVYLNFPINGPDNFPMVNYKWRKYVNISTEKEFDNQSCYVYDLSVYGNNGFFSREFTKTGGYYKHSKNCIEPINHRLFSHYSGNRPASLTVILVDYVIPEIIDEVYSVRNKLT